MNKENLQKALSKYNTAIKELWDFDGLYKEFSIKYCLNWW